MTPSPIANAIQTVNCLLINSQKPNLPHQYAYQKSGPKIYREIGKKGKNNSFSSFFGSALILLRIERFICRKKYLRRIREMWSSAYHTIVISCLLASTTPKYTLFIFTSTHTYFCVLNELIYANTVYIMVWSCDSNHGIEVECTKQCPPHRQCNKTVICQSFLWFS